MRKIFREMLATLTTVADVPANGQPAVSVDTRLNALRVAITGQQTPPPATGWRMSNNTSATRLDALEPLLAQLQTALATLTDVVGAQQGTVATQFALVNADRQKDLAAQQLEAARNDLQEAKDVLQDAAIKQLQAQASGNTAALATQTARIDTAAASIASLQTNLAAAKATADAAQAAVAALGDKGRVLLGLATPASVGILGLGGTLNVAVVFAKPFADDKYTGTVIRATGGAAAMGFSIANRTASGCSVVLTNNGAVSLAVPAGTADLVFTHV